MFNVHSPTFGKLKCPQIKGTNDTACPFGPQNCVFSHDPNVYIKGGLDGRIGLSSMTYFKDLHQRIRAEESACQASEIFSDEKLNAEASKANNNNNNNADLVDAVDKNLEDFLHRAPTGCKLSGPLRQKVLRKLMLWLRQADASSTLARAAEFEFECLMRSGGRVSSIYLSALNDLMKKPPPSPVTLKSPNNDDKDGIINELKALIAKRPVLDEYLYPIKCAAGGMSESVAVSRTCRRCGASFNVKTYYSSYPVNDPNNRCRFHGGKTEKIGGLRVHGCCQAPIGDPNGCETQDWHVYETFSKRDPIPRYEALPFPSKENNNLGDTQHPVVALDAEMFYTVGGYEVSRVTLVDFFTETTLVDVLVEPTQPPVLDYNTRYSGVSLESYESPGGLPVMSFEGMRAHLAQFIDEETILIGHSLDNDLRVLKFAHDFIVDTAIIYPHRSGGLFRMSLKALALGHLSELIQQSSGGHDSKEDCVTCIRLIKKYINK